MALLDQLLSQLQIVEYLAIEGNPVRPVIDRHRLLPALEIDDAEAGVRKSDVLISKETIGIGSPM
jgi:hypothetical protein